MAEWEQQGLFFLTGTRVCWLKQTNKKGGGDGLYVSKQLEFNNRIDLDRNADDIIETRFIEVLNKYGKNLIIGVEYTPPHSNFESFEKSMNEILDNINKKK